MGERQRGTMPARPEPTKGRLRLRLREEDAKGIQVKQSHDALVERPLGELRYTLPPHNEAANSKLEWAWNKALKTVESIQLPRRKLSPAGRSSGDLRYI